MERAVRKPARIIRRLCPRTKIVTKIFDKPLERLRFGVSGPGHEVDGVNVLEPEGKMDLVDPQRDQLLLLQGQQRFIPHPSRFNRSLRPDDDHHLRGGNCFLDDAVEVLTATKATMV